ncbi:MAG: hypothetical protein HY926_00830, partial [Elusimicrobia bacterium]|nr:hypothetical protein [Elusimicrobiota bacterium]
FNLGGTHEAEVLEWTEKRLRVRVPAGRGPGQYRVGVYCNWGSTGFSSGFKDFDILPGPPPAETAAPQRSPCTRLPPGLTTRQRAEALTGAVQSHWMADRIEEGESCAREAIAAHKAAGPGEGLAHAYLHHYYFAYRLGRSDEAYEDLLASARLYRQAIAALPEDQRRSAQWGYTSTLVWLVQMLIHRGELDEAERLAKEKYALHVLLGGDLAVAEQTMGEVALAKGRYEDAIQRFEAAAARYRESGNQAGVRRYTDMAKTARERSEIRGRLGPVEAETADSGTRLRLARARPAPSDPRGALALLRFALTVYASENEGRSPQTLRQLEESGYIAALPRPLLAEHPDPPSETAYPGQAPGGKPPRRLKDSGGWGYDRASGTVFIDCTHQGPKGRFADW